MERSYILQSLVKLSIPIHDIKSLLNTIEWDSDVELAELTNSDVKDIFTRTLNGDISYQDLTLWAELIEGREDISYQEDSIRDIIFELANPDINGEITEKKLKKLLTTFPPGG